MDLWSIAGMSNVLDNEKQQQVLALGRLGWTLRRIEAATGVRRETASGYLRAAGIAVCGRGRPGESVPKPAIPVEVSTDSGPSKPATTNEAVSTDSAFPAPTRASSARRRSRSRRRHARRGAASPPASAAGSAQLLDEDVDLDEFVQVWVTGVPQNSEARLSSDEWRYELG